MMSCLKILTCSLLAVFLAACNGSNRYNYEKSYTTPDIKAVAGRLQKKYLFLALKPQTGSHPHAIEVDSNGNGIFTVGGAQIEDTNVDQLTRGIIRFRQSFHIRSAEDLERLHRAVDYINAKPDTFGSLLPDAAKFEIYTNNHLKANYYSGDFEGSFKLLYDIIYPSLPFKPRFDGMYNYDSLKRVFGKKEYQGF